MRFLFFFEYFLFFEIFKFFPVDELTRIRGRNGDSALEIQRLNQFSASTTSNVLYRFSNRTFAHMEQ